MLRILDNKKVAKKSNILVILPKQHYSYSIRYPIRLFSFDLQVYLILVIDSILKGLPVANKYVFVALAV